MPNVALVLQLRSSLLCFCNSSTFAVLAYRHRPSARVSALPGMLAAFVGIVALSGMALPLPFHSFLSDLGLPLKPPKNC